MGDLDPAERCAAGGDRRRGAPPLHAPGHGASDALELDRGAGHARRADRCGGDDPRQPVVGAGLAERHRGFEQPLPARVDSPHPVAEAPGHRGDRERRDGRQHGAGSRARARWRRPPPLARPRARAQAPRASPAAPRGRRAPDRRLLRPRRPRQRRRARMRRGPRAGAPASAGPGARSQATSGPVFQSADSRLVGDFPQRVEQPLYGRDRERGHDHRARHAPLADSVDHRQFEIGQVGAEAGAPTRARNAVTDRSGSASEASTAR